MFLCRRESGYCQLCWYAASLSDVDVSGVATKTSLGAQLVTVCTYQALYPLQIKISFPHIEIIVHGWQKILENITSGYGSADKSNIFPSDDHNHE